MAERRVIRPDYDEKFTVKEPLEYEEAVQRLIGSPIEAELLEVDELDGDIEGGDS